jgi:predicted Zn finger-like uncharacterized protein
MIVKCEKCQTKFKVADEQIADQGTLVRCSKCQSTFQVQRSARVDDPGAPLAEPLPKSEPESSSLADELFGDLPQSDFAADPPLEEESQFAADPALEDQSEPPAPREEPDHSQFDMPEPPPEEEEVSAAPPRELLPPEEALLPPAPPPSRLLRNNSFQRASRRPPAEAPASPVRGLLTGFFVNVAIAAGLVLVLGAAGTIYANDGKLEPAAFSLRRIGALIKANREALAVESWNGIYDTRAGKPIFYIRGDAQNTASAPSRLRVRADILDGSQLVRSSEVFAGAAAGPEDLYNIESSEGADALNARLDANATAIPPGGRAPFLLAFYDYPPNLSAFRLKVIVRAVGSSEAAAR